MAERVEHLLRLREQQDESGGFLTFIPLPYQVGDTKLVPRQTPPTDDLRTIAASRLLLDNFPHVEAYWVMIGEETASIALHFGADDVNGTLEDERIAHMARAESPAGLAREQILRMIRDAGQDAGRARRPLQRRQGLELSVLRRRSATRPRRASGSTARRGCWLLTEAPLLELGSLAQDARFRRIPERRVTFVIDSNPNYTNVCITDCQFCAFYRKPGDPEAYTLTVEEVHGQGRVRRASGARPPCCSRAATTRRCRSTTISTLVSETRRRFPPVTPHFFTASEIRTMAEVAGQSVRRSARRL